MSSSCRTPMRSRRAQHRDVDGVALVSIAIGLLAWTRLASAAVSRATTEPDIVETLRLRCEVEVRLRRPHVHDRHVAGRERPRLVGADDRGRSKRFDGRQPAHERVTTGHASHANRQRDGGYGRQRFRNRGNREREARLDDRRERMHHAMH